MFILETYSLSTAVKIHFEVCVVTPCSAVVHTNVSENLEASPCRWRQEGPQKHWYPKQSHTLSEPRSP